MSFLSFRKRIQEINFNRKNEQTQAGSKLNALEQTYVLYTYTKKRVLVKIISISFF